MGVAVSDKMHSQLHTVDVLHNSKVFFQRKLSYSYVIAIHYCTKNQGLVFNVHGQIEFLGDKSPLK